MKFLKIIDRKYNMVELPCGKVTNSMDLNVIDSMNEVGNFVVKYNMHCDYIKKWENECKLKLNKYLNN